MALDALVDITSRLPIGGSVESGRLKKRRFLGKRSHTPALTPKTRAMRGSADNMTADCILVDWLADLSV